MSTKVYDGTFPPPDTAPGTITDAATTGSTGLWVPNRVACYHNREGYLATKGNSNFLDFLEWTGGTTQTDQQLIVNAAAYSYLPDSPGALWGLGLRGQAHTAGATNTGYVVNSYPGYAEVKRLLSGAMDDVAVPFSSTAWTSTPAGVEYLLWPTAFGTNPTVLRFRVLRADTLAVLFDQSAQDSYPTMQNPGRPFFFGGYATSDVDRSPIARVRYYTGTGDPSLVSGTLSLDEVTPTTVNLVLSDPGGGATIDYEVSLDGFATAGTAIPGETGLELEYSVSDDQVRTFRAGITVSGSTNYSNIVAAARAGESIGLVALADSIVAGGGESSVLAVMARTIAKALGPRSVAYTNTAQNGSATLEWLKPGTIVEGSPVAGTYYAALVAAANVLIGQGRQVYCPVMIGANESSLSGIEESAARLALILDDLQADLPDVTFILEGNTSKSVADSAAAAFFPEWATAQVALCDGTRVVRGDTSTYRAVANNPSVNLADSVHLTTAGAEMVGIAWAADFIRQFYPKSGVGGGGISRRIGSSRIRGGI